MELEFGLHKGKIITDPNVPTSYLDWLAQKLQNDAQAAIKFAAILREEIIRRRESEAVNLFQLETYAKQILKNERASKEDREWAYSFLNHDGESSVSG